MKDNKSSIFHHITRDPVQNTRIASSEQQCGNTTRIAFSEEQYGGHQTEFQR